MRPIWKRRVRIKLDDEKLIDFVKDILTGPWKWRYHSMFQELTLDLHINNIEEVRQNILEWLKSRKGD